MHFVITGAAGYLGSHMARLLQNGGHHLTLIDNLSNAEPSYLNRILRSQRDAFYQIDITDQKVLFGALGLAIERFGMVDGVFHFAGLKSVDESVSQPARYYRNNVYGTLNLIEALPLIKCNTLIFSSSATVYGDSPIQPIPETAPVAPTNPYGHSKAMCEQLLLDAAHATPGLNVGILRYFNPVGAHPDGDLGESPKGTPNNLMPYVCQVASGQRTHLTIFGQDYPTPDGTGVRDYIHVCDLIEGHWAAYTHLQGLPKDAVLERRLIVNLGTGKGASVLEIVNHASSIAGTEISHVIGDRRPGDIAVALADTQKSQRCLGWVASRSLSEMITSHYTYTVKQGTP